MVVMDAQRDLQNRKRKSRQDSQQSPRHRKRVKTQDARAIAVQTLGKAYANGEIDVDKFVHAREFEIRALEDGMRKSRKALTNRAFQNVPKDLRRRTASHNAKKVPRRLRARAAKEMIEDNTPTGTARRKKLGSRMRLRQETRKKLQKLKSKAKSSKSLDRVIEKAEAKLNVANLKKSKSASREPHVKKNTLQVPPKPKARFRKRQVHKAWLPTHLFHAKRAHMTPPKEPLWRMAIPLSPTAKSYRPTHRASTLRGAVAWDMSYMSTIGLDGSEKSLQGLFVALGVGKDEHPSAWGRFAPLWLAGARFWEGWLYERETWPKGSIAPAVILWCKDQSSSPATQPDEQSMDQGESRKAKQSRRKALIRVHPSAFLQLWEEVLRLAKVQKPAVLVEDLRFEIGSIDLVGPASADVLFRVLRPIKEAEQDGQSSELLKQATALLRRVTNPATLPKNAVLAFDAPDPRIHRGYKDSTVDAAPDTTEKLLELLTRWPVDALRRPPSIFNRLARLTASRRMPSQKSINRRKTVSGSGKQPVSLPTDPCIPVLVYAKRGDVPAQGSWTVLLPWKCILPIWYCLMYQRMESGGTIRFGGLDELRQVAFESGNSWFPGDEPGTKAGQGWEARQEAERKAAWERKPPGRRTAYDSLDLGRERKGEIGRGWSCDWARLLNDENKTVSRLPPTEAVKMLLDKSVRGSPGMDGGLALVKITLIARGAPTTCARIYNLPTNDEELRNKWLDLLLGSTKYGQGGDWKRKQQQQRSQRGKMEGEGEEEDAITRRQLLAARLLQHAPENKADSAAGYPVVPDETDLIGFVTTGNFNLGEGRATAMGNVLLSKILQQRALRITEAEARVARSREHLCIIREAGQALGRLARWELVF